MKATVLRLCCCLLLATAAVPGSFAVASDLSVAITEFMAENHGGLEDADHESPDWIELTNSSDATASLEGWALTDDARVPRKWTFPASTTLAAKERRVIFASNQHRAGPELELHTNFKLAGEGGYLALVRPDGTVAQAFEYPQQEANVSFGLAPGAAPDAGLAGWRYFPTSTPGLANVAAVAGGAAIRGVSHSPAWPAAGEALTVTAEVAAQVTEAKLYYRVQFKPEAMLPMTGNGALYSAVIPASVAEPGQMIRWRVAVTAGGVASRWPINLRADVALPLYLGTTVRRSDVVTPLPVYEIFLADYTKPLNSRGPYHPAETDVGARGAFAWRGVLYDNVFFRRKGTTSQDLYKRSHRVNFNPGHDFVWSPTESTGELNLNAEYPDPSYLRQCLSLWMQRDAGVGAAPHFPVRVQMNGAFWQLAFHTLPADKDLLHFMGLDDRGALYKQVEEVRPVPVRKENRLWEGVSDYVIFAAGINEASSSRFVALYDTTDVPTVLNYLAVARLTQEADDVWSNMVLYRDSEGTGEWRIVPYDLNLSFGQLYYDSQPWNTILQATMDNVKSHPLCGTSVCRTQYPGDYHFNKLWNRLYDVVIQDPRSRAKLLRRMRTLMDQYYKPPGTPYAERPLEAKIDALWASIQADAELDRKAWGQPPNSGVYGLGVMPAAQAVADLKNLYVEPRRTHLYITHGVGNTGRTTGLTNADKAGIPEAQPADVKVDIVAAEYAPASGQQDEEYIELANHNAFAVDVSGWALSGGVAHTMKGGTVLAAGESLYLSPNVNAFRARAASPHGGEGRFVQGNYSGHLSSLGETLALRNTAGATVATFTYTGPGTPLQSNLAIASLGYAPANGDAEFVELVNRSASESLDLTGVHFSKGVDFSFTSSAIAALAPGARALVVRNVAAFEAVYGPGKPIAGEFANGTRLDNAGEALKLEDAAGRTIFEFAYAPTAPWPAEGVIVVANPGTGHYPEDPGNWRLPVIAGGTPGVAESTTPFSGSAAELVVYATGGEAKLQVGFEMLPGESMPAVVLSFQRALAADGAVIVPEAAGDLGPDGTWFADGAHLVKLSESRLGNSGQTLVRYRLAGFGDATHGFARLRVQTRN